MSQNRLGAPGPFRRWYADRKAERQALTEYKTALRTLSRLHRHRDRDVVPTAHPRRTTP